MEFERTPVQQLPYSSGLMSQSCWFLEFKSVLQMIAAGRTDEEIRTACVEGNLLGAPKEYRAGRMYLYMMSRAKVLDQDLLDLFIAGDLGTQKLINLIAMVRGDRLFFEFLYEVYRDKVIVGYPCLEAADVNTFFHRKAAESETVDGWSESTRQHLRSNYFTSMTDAGLLRREKKQYLITRPILDARLEDCLKRSGDQAILTAIKGVP